MATPLTRLRDLIKKNKIDAALISSIPNIVYLTGYSGFSKDEREAYLFIAPTKQYILTDGRYSAAVKTLIPDFKLIEISSKLSAGEAIRQLAKKHNIKRLGFEGHNISFLEHKKLKKYFNNIYHLSISDLRLIKTPDEIAKIEEACKLGDKAFDYVLKKIHLGISEKELAFEIEFFIRKNGGDPSFPTIVAFGKNSAIPHHLTSNRKLKTDNIVLLDFGVKLNNYCSDMTRTIFFGRPTTVQKKIYDTVLKAQEEAIEFLTQRCHAEFISASRSKDQILKQVQDDTGTKASEVDRIARDYIVSKGYPTIPHSLGHGIGIEVHEAPHLSPKSKDTLNEGMVFSIEPGIYLPAEASAKEGIPEFGGIRIEDLAVLEKGGIRLLTHSPKDLIEI